MPKGQRVSVGERQSGFVPGWWCDAEVDGTAYRVGVLAIPTDTPRPDTWGIVRDSRGKVVWQERVPASFSVRQILKRAGILA